MTDWSNHPLYMNAEPWGTGYQADPKWYARKGYPAWEQWPHGEALWSVHFCYANNEFTPQQTCAGRRPCSATSKPWPGQHDRAMSLQLIFRELIGIRQQADHPIPPPPTCL